MGIFSFISDVFKPAANLIDNLHTSDEEKLKVKAKLEKIQTDMATKIIEYEQKLMSSKSAIIKAEATGHSWLQRNWRPITMLTFLVLVVLDAFGILNAPLPRQAWTLLQIGLGGYVVGRSIEKTAPAMAEILKR